MLIASVGVLGAGCTASHRQPDPSATPTPTTTDTPVNAARAEALTAYQLMWRAYLMASATGGRSETDLATHATGPALTTLRASLATLRSHSLVMRGRLTGAATITTLVPTADPTTARIRDCVEDATTVAPRGARVAWDDGPGVHRLVQATVSRTAAG